MLGVLDRPQGGAQLRAGERGQGIGGQPVVGRLPALGLGGLVFQAQPGDQLEGLPQFGRRPRLQAALDDLVIRDGDGWALKDRGTSTVGVVTWAPR